jgi:hypothetical protein
VIFHVDGRGLMYSYVLFFPAVIFFLHLVCERHDFQFCLLSSSSWVFVALAVGSVWVSGWRCPLHFILLVDDLLLLYEIDS